jgi:hypothetical protein
VGAAGDVGGTTAFYSLCLCVSSNRQQLFFWTQILKTTVWKEDYNDNGRGNYGRSTPPSSVGIGIGICVGADGLVAAHDLSPPDNENSKSSFSSPPTTTAIATTT